MRMRGILSPLAGWIFRWRTWRARRLFDPAFYLSRYPDVAASGIDPFRHYLDHGWMEGRDPSASFSTLAYLNRHLAGRSDPPNPLLHHASRWGDGGIETATASAEDLLALQAATVGPFFDERHYRRAASLAPDDDALLHYLREGWTRGLSPHPSFSPRIYLARHAHVRQAGIEPFYHSVSLRGVRARDEPEDRPGASPAPKADDPAADDYAAIASGFDRIYYLGRYGDVAESHLDPVAHYIDFGAREDRDPAPLFSTRYYRARYMREADREANPLLHYMREGQAAGNRPNPHGLELWPTPTAPPPEAWARVPGAAILDGCEVALVMPVFRGYDETLAAIHSVLVSTSRERFALVVVDDASPDPDLSRTLRDLSERGLFLYQRNPTNVGFIDSVNRGLDRVRGKDVVLLNSDILVFGDWLDRLLWHARRDPDVATVTPFSNNATICSYPEPCIDNRIKLEADPETIDGDAAVANRRTSCEIPTGVGFCMVVKGRVLDRIGFFDSATFGAGYGEENDFCMRAMREGYRHLLAQDVFVFHSGSVSFGGAKAHIWDDVRRALEQRHPDYFARVRNHILVDPARQGRMRLDLLRFARDVGPGAALFVLHEMGGGIETQARHLSRRLASEGRTVVTLRLSWPDLVRVDILDPSGTRHGVAIGSPISFHREAELLETFLGWLSPAFVHVHSFAGSDWAATRGLMDLFGARGDLFVTLHDYESVCHRFHLVTADFTYCGLAGTDQCRRCLALDRSEPQAIDPDERRRVFAAFVRRADAVFAPSHDTADRLRPHLPEVRIAVRPHEDDVTPANPGPSASNGTRHVAVVGAIGKHKGSDVVYGLGTDARARNLPIRYTIVGYSDDPDRMRPVGIRETGRYRDDEQCLTLLRDLEVDLILIPSIWPETYCYTLSLALASGLPVAAFGLGAQAERLRVESGAILDPRLIADPQALSAALLDLPLQRRAWAAPGLRYGRVLTDYYGRSEPPDSGSIRISAA